MDIRIPFLNAFKLRITGNITSGTHTETADMNVVRNLIVNFVRRGRIFQAHGIDMQGRIVILNLGTLPSGTYGVELVGYYNGEPWRFFQKDVFEIVRQNSDATPAGSGDVPTYDVSFDLNFGGESVSPEYVDAAIAAHDADEQAHADIREALQTLETELRQEIAEAGEVNDVQIDGQSILDPETKVANIDSSQFGKVDDVKVNGQSVLDPTTKEASINITASVVEDDTPGDPEAEATMRNGNVNIEFAHVKGDRGNGIASVTEEISPISGGLNKHIFTDDDGQTREIHTKNGEKGEPGDNCLVGQGDLALSQVVSEADNKAITPKGVFKALTNITETDESLQEITDGYYIHDDGDPSVYKETLKTGITGYIDCAGALSVEVSVVVLTSDNVSQHLAFYDENQDFISSIPREVGEAEDTVIKTYEVPANAAYFRTTYWNETNRQTHGAFYCKVIFGKENKFEKINEQIEDLNSRAEELEEASEEINENVYTEIPVGEETVDLSQNVTSASASRAVAWNSGSTYSSTTGDYDVSNFVDISGCKAIIYSRPFSTRTNQSTKLGMAFYEEATEASYIKGQMAVLGATEYTLTRIDVPENAKYVRLSILNNTTTYGSPTLIGIKSVTQKTTSIAKIKETLDESLPQKVVLTQRDICYGHQVTAQGGDTTEYTKFGCTSYVCCKGADSVTYKNVVTDDFITGHAIGLAFYDESKNFLAFNSLVCRSNAEDGSEEVTVKVPSSAWYLKATYWDGENIPSGAGEFHAEFTSAEAACNGKRESIGDDEYIFFTVPVNKAVDNFWDDAVNEAKLGSTLIDTTGVLLLPPNYTKNGKKTKLIINFHGWSHYVKYGEWGNGNAGFLIQKQRWAAAGFAVMDCNNWRYTLETHQSGLGSRQSMDAYRRCFEWVKENFNIDERPYIVCGSAGGPTGINCCYTWGDVRAAVWLDCWIDLENTQNSYTSCKAYYPELYGFNDEDVWEADKVKGYDPYGRVFYIDDVPYAQIPICPVKVLWRSTEFAGDFYDALKNSGAYVTIRQVNANSISHADLVSGGENQNPEKSAAIDAEIIAFLKSF